MQADRATLWLVDEESNELFTSVAEGMSGSDGKNKEIRIDIGKGIVGHVVCSGETFSCLDAYDSDKFNPSVDRSSGYRTRQILCVPLTSATEGSSKIVGAIQVINRAESAEDASAAFTDGEQQLLVALGEQIVGAVEHCHMKASTAAEKQESLMQLKRMQAQLQRARTEGQALDGLLQNLSEVISGQASLQSLMDTVLTQACELVGADRAALFILDEVKNELWTFIGKGESAQVIRIPVGQGIAGTVGDTGQTIMIEDAYLDMRFSRAADRKTGYRTQSILASAVRNKQDKIVGVLQLINKLDESTRIPKPFEPQDEAIVEHFSSEIGDALESGARIEESKHKFDNMQSQMAQMQAHMQSTMVKTKEQAEIMIQLAKDLAAINDRANLLSRVIGDAKTLMGASKVIMYLHKEKTNELCGHGDVKKDTTVSAEKGVLGQVLRSGELAETTDENENLFLLYVPVQVQGESGSEVLGVLEIVGESEFDDDSKNMILAFSSHVALALANFDKDSSSNSHMLELERKLANAAKNGHKLSDLSKALANDLETSALFQQVVSRASDILCSDRATMFLVDSHTKELYSMAADGTETIRIPQGVGLAGHVVKSTQTVNITDCYSDSRFNRDMDAKTGYYTRSMICIAIPDMHGDESVGCLQLLNKLSVDEQIRRKFKAIADGPGGVNWKKLFNKYDEDDSGSLEFDEFKTAVRKDGKMSVDQLSEPDLRFLFDRIDEDSGGEIEIEEFIGWLSKVEGSAGDDNEEKAFFDDDDEELLENLVTEVAIAVDHMRRDGASSDQLAKLNAQMQDMQSKMKESGATSQQLLEFGKELATKSELSEVFEEAIRDARHLVQADRATLWLVDEESNELYTCLAQGIENSSGNGKEIRIDIGKGIVGHVVCSGEIFSCSDACKFQ